MSDSRRSATPSRQLLSGAGGVVWLQGVDCYRRLVTRLVGRAQQRRWHRAVRTVLRACRDSAARRWPSPEQFELVCPSWWRLGRLAGGAEWSREGGGQWSSVSRTFLRVCVRTMQNTALLTYFCVYCALCRRPLCVVWMATISKACLPTLVSSWARGVSVIGRC